jgi:tryptophan halogenase
MSQLQGEVVLGPTVIPFKTGVRERPWVKNCVSIGLSCGFIEPLESTALHLIYKGMDYLLRFMPDMDADQTLAAEYNRRMVADYEEIRDFIVLHYVTTRRDDTPFWRDYQKVDPPESLKERIALFKAAGVLRDGVDDMFRAPAGSR